MGSRVFTISACILVLASGCAESVAISDGVANSPYREALERELRGDLPRFQKDILMDGVVTDSELAEAHGRFKTCFEDQGYSVGIDPNDGSFTWGGRAGDDRVVVEAAYDGCHEKFVSFVSPFYFDSKKNPNNEDSIDLIIDCLERNHYIERGSASGITPETVFSLNTEENTDCFLDPRGS